MLQPGRKFLRTGCIKFSSYQCLFIGADNGILRLRSSMKDFNLKSTTVDTGPSGKVNQYRFILLLCELHCFIIIKYRLIAVYRIAVNTITSRWRKPTNQFELGSRYIE